MCDYLKQGRQSFSALVEGCVGGQLKPRCALHSALRADAIGQVDELICDELSRPLNPPPRDSLRSFKIFETFSVRGA